MGWGRMLLLGDWGQQMDIEDQRRDLETMRRELLRTRAAGGSDRLEALELENAELRLYLAALIRYLIGRGDIDVDEFRVLVDTIDQEDGRHDGGFRGEMP